MAIYIKLFEVLFPVFFVVGIGYFLGKKNPKIDTNFITTTASNADLELRANGTGKILIPSNNLQVDNNLTVISYLPANSAALGCKTLEP